MSGLLADVHNRLKMRGSQTYRVELVQRGASRQLKAGIRKPWVDGAFPARFWPISVRPCQPTGRWHSWAVPKNVSQIPRVGPEWPGLLMGSRAISFALAVHF